LNRATSNGPLDIFSSMDLDAQVRKGPAALAILASGGAAALFVVATASVPTVLVVSIFVACVSCWLMQQAVGLSPRLLTISAFWYWLYLAFVFIPAFSVFGSHAEPYRTMYMVAVDSALISVPLGVMAVNVTTGFHKEDMRRYFRAPLAVQGGMNSLRPGFLALLVVAIVLSVLYCLQISSIPLYDLIVHPGDYNGLVTAREESLKLMNSPLVYAYYVVRSTIFPLLILIGLGEYLRTRRTEWKVLFGAAIAVGLIYSALTIAKSPVCNLVLFVAFFMYLRRGGNVKITSLLLVALAFLLFPMFVIMSEQAGAVGLSATLADLSHRLFGTPSEVLYYYFEVFPGVVPHQHGATIGKVAWVLGVPTFDDANFVGRYMMARGAGFRSTVTANAPFLGSLYADFSLAGVVVGSFIAGVTMQAVQVTLMRRPKTTLNLALFAFLLVTFAWLNTTTLPVVLLSDGGLLVFAFAWLIDLMQQRNAFAVDARSLKANRRYGWLQRSV
jgi:oligosaccharide repeat unit polymerase